MLINLHKIKRAAEVVEAHGVLGRPKYINTVTATLFLTDGKNTY